MATDKEARDSLGRRRILKAEELVGLGYRRKAGDAGDAVEIQ